MIRSITKDDDSEKTSKKTAADFLPSDRSIASLRAAAEHCHGCDLYKHATGTVFGAGHAAASIVLVGEQPGDQEDKKGMPFVGPAGKLLDRALEEAGLDREDVYLTNAVKHFSFIQKGKQRLHKTPRVIEVNACLPWLKAELDHIKPDVIVCLGATAAQALLGKSFKVTKERGVLIKRENMPAIVATYHPSAILRALDHEGREQLYHSLVTDLVLAKESAKSS